MLALSILLSLFIGSSSTSILIDGCPERNFDTKAWEDGACFQGWSDAEFRQWVFLGMCSGDHSYCPQGSTPSPAPSKFGCIGDNCGGSPTETGPTTQPTNDQGTTPTRIPSDAPSDAPSTLPTFITTVVDTIVNRLTEEPTVAPTDPLPTSAPLEQPSRAPSSTPSVSPSSPPSVSPSDSPSDSPSSYPTWIGTGTVRCPHAKKVNHTA